MNVLIVDQAYFYPNKQAEWDTYPPIQRVRDIARYVSRGVSSTNPIILVDSYKSLYKYLTENRLENLLVYNVSDTLPLIYFSPISNHLSYLYWVPQHQHRDISMPNTSIASAESLQSIMYDLVFWIAGSDILRGGGSLEELNTNKTTLQEFIEAVQERQA